VRHAGYDNEPMEVRLARPGDAGQIGLVHIRSWQEAYRDLLPQEYLDSLDPDQRAGAWKRWLEQPDSLRGATLVIGTGDRLDGFAGVGPTRDEDRSPELTIFNFGS
jgi:hypothetical protein